MIARALVIAAALAASAGVAHAGRGAAEVASGAVRDGEHLYELVVARGWTPVTAPDGTLLAYQAPGGRAHLAVTRVAIGRTGADRDRLVDEIERGVEGATEGYRRRSRRLRDSGPVPLLELDYDRRAAGARASSRVLTRFLLFRRHTVVLSIALEPGAPRALRKQAEAMARSFTAYLP
ncbi:MAG TPA: hypothetical protein VKZ63_09540 [Kofleriaceae bacterium]|nr:hypothetical protein [Kofleriaceae bacterium]